MSISENHGGLYKNLEELRKTEGTCDNNFFRSLGYDYLYVSEGHNLLKLIQTFQIIKDINHPIVVHVNTEKGHGYQPAINDKENWHFTAPFFIETGMRKESFADELYSSITADFLLEKMKNDKRIVAISSGTPTVMGFTAQKRKIAGEQFVDVGSAEEQAVAMASGIAKAGDRPVWGVYSCFITRAFDQLQQVLCINNNPAIILVFWGSLTSMNDVTHLCWWDIPMTINIPNLICLAPSNKEEYVSMLEWSLIQTEHPVCIRVPFGRVVHSSIPITYNNSKLTRFEIRHRGKDVALIGVGTFIYLAEQVAEKLKVFLALMLPLSTHDF